MSHKIVKTSTMFGKYKIIYIETDPLLDAGDIVNLLLAKGIDPEVSWEDNGDCGMKDGGCCKGSEFRYPAMFNPWGGCFYHIEFTYEGVPITFFTSDNEQNQTRKKVIASCPLEKYDSQMILSLLEE